MSHFVKLPLSVAIITKNEEVRLPDCLASIDFADDVVVVDSESTDRTVEVARAAGARVFVEPWRGFGPQKQYAVDQCRNRWVLILDADERIPPETAIALRYLVTGGADCDAYSILRKNYYTDRLIRHGSWQNDRVTRLFDKTVCYMPSQMVHESLVVNGTVGRMDSPILHYARTDLHQSVDKLNRYSTIGAREMFQRGRVTSMAEAILRSLWCFGYNYILRAGFLDMSAGFIIAVSDAVETFFKYAKLYELHRQSINVHHATDKSTHNRPPAIN